MAEKREKMTRPAPLGDLLTAAFRGKPAEKRLKEGKIWQVWDAVVGKQIAARARPVNIRDGILTIAVSSAPWMQQLNFLKKGIAAKLNTAVGEELVSDIYLKAGQAESPPLTEKHRKKKDRPLTDQEQQTIAEQSASIKDAELREVFARLMARHFCRDSGLGNRDS